MSVLRACLSLLLLGCDPPAKPLSLPEEEQPSPAADEPHDPAAPAAEQLRIAAPLRVTLAEVRKVGETVEVEVALSRPLPPTSARPPSLQIGDEVVTRSRAGSGGRMDRLVFTIPVAQYKRMPKDAELIVRAGLFSNEADAVKPRLSEAR